jgi:hypothetical protein
VAACSGKWLPLSYGEFLVSVPDPANLKPHDLAKAEIEAWRGRCLNVFARTEKAVTETLAQLQHSNAKVLLEPLAGQRLKTLETIMATYPASAAQQKARETALSSWGKLDVMRPFLSHGILTELVGRTGDWHLQLDFIAVKKGKCEEQRLNWSKAEALDFEESLKKAFNALSNQLGQLRKSAGSPQQKPEEAKPKKPDPAPKPA